MKRNKKSHPFDGTAILLAILGSRTSLCADLRHSWLHLQNPSRIGGLGVQNQSKDGDHHVEEIQTHR